MSLIPYGFNKVNEFTPAPNGGSNPWRSIGNIANWSYDDQEKSFLLTAASSDTLQIKIYILGPSAFRVRFNPNSTDYSSNLSSAVVNRNLGPTKVLHNGNSGTVASQTVDQNSNSNLLIELDKITINVGLTPYGISVQRQLEGGGSQTIHETDYDYNLVYIPQFDASGNVKPEVTACFMKVAPGAGYYGFGEKAGINLNKNFRTMTFFNYDNFTYQGPATDQPDSNAVVTSGPGPLNVEEPLYNSMPILVEWNPNPSGDFAGDPYAYAIFLDNPGQSFFNIQTNDYSQYMSGKYYFGATYKEMDYYFMAGDNIPSVLGQYATLTGPCPMPPMYALGYQQGGYGYYDTDHLIEVAEKYRQYNIPIDGLHIDVDFQDNYRTFTTSKKRFPEATKGNNNNSDGTTDLFHTLHGMGFKCSTNITGIMTMVKKGDEYPKTHKETPYSVQAINLSYNENGYSVVGEPYQRDVITEGKDKNYLITDYYLDANGNKQGPGGPFITNESYGCNTGFNPKSTIRNVNNVSGCDGIPLGTYGHYADLLNKDVKAWWSGNYYELINNGLDMIWQDMTCPAVTRSTEGAAHYKTLPGDLLMSDLDGSQVPNAKIHNAYALNMINATYHGLTAIKGALPDGHYNKNKRNFIIARGGYAGVHRYAGNWTGDSASSWEFLSINISEVINWGMSGQPLSGCDIGGFANGTGSEAKYGVTVHDAFSTDPNNPPYITGGQTEPTLFTRWMTMGAFLPWYRNHYDGYTKAYQEPYNYTYYKYGPNRDDRVLPACSKYIRIRYALLQLFYDAMYECTQTGVPICRSLFLNEPQDPNLYPPSDLKGVSVSPYNPSDEYTYDITPTYRDCDQFFVGSDFLVAPLILERWQSYSYSPGQTHYGASRPVYLPKGSNWYAFTGNVSFPSSKATEPILQTNLPTVLDGKLGDPTPAKPNGYTANWSFNSQPLDLVPIYIREGAVIPVRQLESYVGEWDKNYLTFNIYPGSERVYNEDPSKDNSYTCYQDDHVTMDAEKKQAYRTTRIEHQLTASGKQITLTRTYDNYQPPEDFYYIALLGQKKSPSSVIANGQKLSLSGNGTKDLANSGSNGYYYCESNQTIYIKIFDTESTMKIFVSGISQ